MPCLLHLTPADVIAIAAVFIAVLSMAGTFWQAVLTRRHNRLSVRPQLDYVASHYPDKPISLTIVNNGLGTAVVKRMRISFQGEDCPLLNTDMPKRIIDELMQRDLRANVTVLGPNSPIAAGGNLAVVIFPNSIGNVAIHNRAVEFMHAVGLIVDYESMYGDAFTLTKAPNLR